MINWLAVSIAFISIYFQVISMIHPEAMFNDYPKSFHLCFAFWMQRNEDWGTIRSQLVSFAATGSREREVLKMKFLSSLGN